MKDRDFLIWIHERLNYTHGEDCLKDYMRKLRCIIKDYPSEILTPNDGRGTNSMEELQEILK